MLRACLMHQIGKIRKDMAYRIIYQNPRDLESDRRAIGVLMPFNNDNVFVPTYNTLEAYKVNLYNFFMTEKKERYLNPELGSTLLSFLFNPATDEGTIRGIQETIRSEMIRFFPRLEVINIQVDDFPEENAVQVDVWFKIKGTELKDHLLLDISK